MNSKVTPASLHRHFFLVYNALKRIFQVKVMVITYILIELINFDQFFSCNFCVNGTSKRVTLSNKSNDLSHFIRFLSSFWHQRFWSRNSKGPLC